MSGLRTSPKHHVRVADFSSPYDRSRPSFALAGRRPEGNELMPVDQV